jgi:hypothetical protein
MREQWRRAGRISMPQSASSSFSPIGKNEDDDEEDLKKSKLENCNLKPETLRARA